jgi:hypothetical protein
MQVSTYIFHNDVQVNVIGNAEMMQLDYMEIDGRDCSTWYQPDTVVDYMEIETDFVFVQVSNELVKTLKSEAIEAINIKFHEC